MEGSGAPAPDPSAGIQADVTALGSALANIATYQGAMRDEINTLEVKIAAEPSAPVSSIDLTALKAALDGAVAEAQQLGIAPPVPEPPTGSGSTGGSAGTDPTAGGGSAAPAPSGGTPGVTPPQAP